MWLITTLTNNTSTSNTRYRRQLGVGIASSFLLSKIFSIFFSYKIYSVVYFYSKFCPIHIKCRMIYWQLRNGTDYKKKTYIFRVWDFDILGHESKQKVAVC